MYERSKKKRAYKIWWGTSTRRNNRTIAITPLHVWAEGRSGRQRGNGHPCISLFLSAPWTLSLFNERSRLVFANGYSLKHTNYIYALFFFDECQVFILVASVLVHRRRRRRRQKKRNKSHEMLLNFRSKSTDNFFTLRMARSDAAYKNALEWKW